MVGEKTGRHRRHRRRHAAGRRPRLPDEHGGQAAARGPRGAGAPCRRGAGRHGRPRARSASRSWANADGIDRARLQAQCRRSARRPQPAGLARQAEGRLLRAAAPGGRAPARVRGAARSRARHQEPHAGQPRPLSRGVRAQGHRRWAATSTGRRRAEDARRIIAELCQSVGRAHGRQVEVDGRRGDRPQRPSRGAGHRADRDRSRRVHHPAPPRAAEPHHRAGGASHQGPGRRHLPRASSRARLHQAADRAQRPGRRGAPRAAPEVPRRRCRHHRRQLPGRRDRLVDAGDQRGQRRSHQHAAAGCTSCWPASRR